MFFLFCIWNVNLICLAARCGCNVCVGPGTHEPFMSQIVDFTASFFTIYVGLFEILIDLTKNAFLYVGKWLGVMLAGTMPVVWEEIITWIGDSNGKSNTTHIILSCNISWLNQTNVFSLQI